VHIQAIEQRDNSLERIWALDRQYVRRMLIGLARDIDLADDLLQETYLKSRDGIESYRGDNDRAWLSTIARNVFLTHIRRRYVSAETSDDDTADRACYSPVGCVDHIELIRVRQAIQKLDPNLRTALWMKHYCGFTYHEIAEQTNCAVGTAKWRVSMAVGMLKDALGVTEEPVEVTCAELSRTRTLDYLYGALSPDESEAVKHHLQGCRKCQSRLDSTGKILAALDALEHEHKYVHIVELGMDGVPTLYGIMRFSKPESGEINFCAGKSVPFEYMGVQGEELVFTKEDNDNPDYPNTYMYCVKLPTSMAPGEMCNFMCISRMVNHPAISESDGCWEYHWNQLDSVDKDWGYVLAIRLPADSHLVSADPPAMETKNTAGTTLLWRTIQAASQRFECNIKYRLSDNAI